MQATPSPALPSLHTGVESMSGAGTAWSRERYLNFVNQVLLRLQALPGVNAAALTTTLPLDAGIRQGTIVPDVVPTPSDRTTGSRAHY